MRIESKHRNQRVGLRAAEGGVALIMAMIVVLGLGILAAGFAFSMKVEMRLASNTTRDPQMEWLGRSGVELARFVLIEKMKIPGESRFDSLSQMWAGGPLGTNEVLAAMSLNGVRLGDGVIDVEIEDLERRFNINAVSADILMNALADIGVDPVTSSVILDSLADWVDPDDNTRVNGHESEDYLAEPNPPFPPYVAKNGAVDTLPELLLVRGIHPAIYFGTGGVGLKDLFTAIGGLQININTAPIEVLRLVPGIDEVLALGIVQTRAGFDGVEGTEDDLPFLRVDDLGLVPGFTAEHISLIRNFCTVRSSSFVVTVKVRMGDYVKTYHAVLARIGSRDVAVLAFQWD